MTRWLPGLSILLLIPMALAAEAPIKPGSVTHRTSKKHGHPYSLYVPSSYSPRASMPLVLSSHGRNGSGKGEIDQWVGHANKVGFIVACPDMCSATVDRPPTSSLRPEEEDDEVLVSIYQEVAGQFRVNRRAVMITGFSGGGNPSYYTGLRHPDLITHICTRGGNWAPQWLVTDQKLLEAGKARLDIYIYYGDKDHPLILGENGQPGQAVQAYESLTKAGYPKVKIEMIKGMGHASRAGIAAGWFGEYLAKNRKLFADGDKADALMSEIQEAIGREQYRDACRDLKKLQSLEEKSGLAPDSEKILAALEKIGGEMLEAAKKAMAAGETGEAVKIAGRVARDFKGLPVEAEAKAMVKAWQE
jgi:poly(3-hydroxybutyrate) depolymerase